MLVRTSRKRRGTALLEFALIAPLFFFIMFFTIDMGRMVMISGAVNDAAYVAARSGAQRGSATINGNAQAAFERSVNEIPGLSSSDTSAFQVVQGTCTTTSTYIVVEATQQVRFMTPGLGELLSLFSGRAAPDTSEWSLSSRGVALCEVVR